MSKVVLEVENTAFEDNSILVYNKTKEKFIPCKKSSLLSDTLSRVNALESEVSDLKEQYEDLLAKFNKLVSYLKGE